MRPLTRCALLLLLISCGDAQPGGEKPVVDLIGQVATEVREKPRVQMIIRITGESPTEEERVLLRSIEDSIERQRLGRLVNSGTAPGQMSVTVEVDRTAEGIETLREVARSAGILQRVSFRVQQRD